MLVDFFKGEKSYDTKIVAMDSSGLVQLYDAATGSSLGNFQVESDSPFRCGILSYMNGAGIIITIATDGEIHLISTTDINKRCLRGHCVSADCILRIGSQQQIPFAIRHRYLLSPKPKIENGEHAIMNEHEPFGVGIEFDCQSG